MDVRGEQSAKLGSSQEGAVAPSLLHDFRTSDLTQTANKVVSAHLEQTSTWKYLSQEKKRSLSVQALKTLAHNRGLTGVGKEGDDGN
jgi:hypothetical protein